MTYFTLTYTGNDGSHNEHEYYGTLKALLTYITGLEERGCHGVSATDKDVPVYDNGDLL